MFREPVPWVEAIWILHRKKILIAGACAIILLVTGIIALLTRTDPLQKECEGIRAELVVLESRLMNLESQPTSSGYSSPEATLKQLEQKATDVHAGILSKLAIKSEDGVKMAKDDLSNFDPLIKQGQASVQSANKPVTGSGPVVVEVRKLIPELKGIQPRAESLRNEAQVASNNNISNQADEILESITKEIKRASKLLPKPAPPNPPDLLTKFEAKINALLDDATKQVEGFKLPLPPEPPSSPPILPSIPPPDPRIPVILHKILKRDVKGAIQIPTDFHFELGKDELKLKAKADLELLRVTIVKDFPKADVVVIGFTDDVGSEEIDTKLSLNRAVRITDELNKSNISAKPAGFGRQTPVGDNTTEEGRARNRRAEVWVVPE
jgi:outer membrane protein OmpA-like peptidoglycan-associated protein